MFITEEQIILVAFAVYWLKYFLIRTGIPTKSILP